MDIKCEVIQDLLQLHVDDLCSKESKKLIEEHLKGCEDCRQFLQILREKEPLKAMEDQELQLEEEKSKAVESRLLLNIKKRMLLIELICLSIGAFGGLYTTLFVDQFKLILIFPAIGCAAYLIIKRFWIPPVLVFGVSIIGCLVMGRVFESIMLSMVNAFLALIGCIIGYSLRKIFERSN